MTDSPHLTGAKRIEHAAREERLARALRDNLHRRKQQARAKEARAAATPAEQPADEPPA
jgi:hypothetical protein